MSSKSAAVKGKLLNRMSKTNGNGFIGFVSNNIGILSVLLVLFVIMTIASPMFLTKSNILTVFRQIATNMMLSIGMTFVIILGGIDLSGGAIISMVGVITVSLNVINGVFLPLAIVIGLSCGLLVGFIDGFIISRLRVPSFIVTLAMMNVCRGIAYIYTGGKSIRILDDAFVKLGTGYLFDMIPYPVIYMIVFIIIAALILNKTKLGTYVYAIGGNREAAKLSGVPIKRVETIVFMISGFLTAFAGILLAARMYSAQPSVGEGYEMDAIAACVLGGISMQGGKGRISGTIIGVLVIGIISNGLNLLGINSYYQLVVKGMIVLLAIYIDSLKNIKERKN